MSGDACDKWHTTMNSNPDGTSISKYCQIPYFFWRECGKHLAFTSPNAIAKNANWSRCRYCQDFSQPNQRCKKPSKWELHAVKVITYVTQNYPHHLQVVIESKALSGKFGATDFSIVSEAAPRRYRLEVEIDGEQHNNKDYMTKAAFAQQARDAAKDEAIIKQDRCLVRLHYEDMVFWEQKLIWALDLLIKHHEKPFVLYTKHYGKSDKRRCHENS